MSGRPKAIPSRTSRSLRSGELAVAAGGRADPGHGQAEHRDERIRVARGRTARARRARGTARSRRRAPAAPGRSRRGRAGRPARSPARGPGTARGTPPSGRRELEPGGAGMAAVPDEQVAAVARGRRRDRATPSLRHDARTTSPSSAPTTAGRPRSSASRAATSPTMPTRPRPRTTVAGIGRRPRRRPPGPRRPPSSSGRGGPGWPPRARRRGSPASAGSSASSSRAASRASPTRPAALSRGARANDDRLEVDRRRARSGPLEQRRDPGPRRAFGAARARAARSPGSRRRSARRRRRSRSWRGRRGRARPPDRPARRRGAAGRP